MIQCFKIWKYCVWVVSHVSAQDEFIINRPTSCCCRLQRVKTALKWINNVFRKVITASTNTRLLIHISSDSVLMLCFLLLEFASFRAQFRSRLGHPSCSMQGTNQSVFCLVCVLWRAFICLSSDRIGVYLIHHPHLHLLSDAQQLLIQTNRIITLHPHPSSPSSPFTPSVLPFHSFQ